MNTEQNYYVRATTNSGDLRSTEPDQTRRARRHQTKREAWDSAREMMRSGEVKYVQIYRGCAVVWSAVWSATEAGWFGGPAGGPIPTPRVSL